METVVTVIMTEMAREMVVEMVMAPFHHHPLVWQLEAHILLNFKLPQNQTYPRSFQEPLLFYT